MKSTVLRGMISTLIAISGCLRLTEAVLNGRTYPTYVHNGQYYDAIITASPPVLRTYNRTAMLESMQYPHTTTPMSVEPRTSISVHTVVRNSPVYQPAYTEDPFSYSRQSSIPQTNSFSYSYHDRSSTESMKTTESTTTTEASTKAPRSFWNSQKAALDARRQQSSKKFSMAFSRPTVSIRTTVKPVVEFKKRERPKFGVGKKSFRPYKESVTYNSVSAEQTTTATPTTTSTRATSVLEATQSDKATTTTKIPLTSKSPWKLEKDSTKSEKTLKGLNEAELKLPSKTQTVKQALKEQNNQIVGRIGEMPLHSATGSAQTQYGQFQQLPNTQQNPSKFDDSIAVQYLNNQKALRQFLQEAIQQSAQNTQPNQQGNAPIYSQDSVHQRNVLQDNLRNLQGNVFIAAQPPPGTSGRNPTASSQPNSDIMQRLGSLGISAGIGGIGGGGGGSKYPGGSGSGGGFSVNLGPVPDPITFILKLLSLIPRPLLNLNSKIFFGIELGNKVGLVPGAGKTG